MNNNFDEEVKKIFKDKYNFHKKQAKLPIEEKIKIMIEMQKIVVGISNRNSKAENHRVWK